MRRRHRRCPRGWLYRSAACAGHRVGQTRRAGGRGRAGERRHCQRADASTPSRHPQRLLPSTAAAAGPQHHHQHQQQQYLQLRLFGLVPWAGREHACDAPEVRGIIQHCHLVLASWAPLRPRSGGGRRRSGALAAVRDRLAVLWWQQQQQQQDEKRQSSVGAQWGSGAEQGRAPNEHQSVSNGTAIVSRWYRRTVSFVPLPTSRGAKRVRCSRFVCT